MQLLAREIETAAGCDLTALISGESGTGKELVAFALHRLSARAHMPFISINCGAITETLMEAELFGHERGAFTGAYQRRKGFFEAANNGTLFLDEISEMSLASQVKLLRVLQEGAIRPVGAHREIPVNVRAIVATNRILPREVSAGRFREDLFYRIAILTIHVPPLRERLSDVPSLAEHFRTQTEKKIAGKGTMSIEPDAIDALTRFRWPGNVRQLQHVVENLIVTTPIDSVIDAEAVHRALRNYPDIKQGLTEGESLNYFNGCSSLDDLLDQLMLDLYDTIRESTGNHTDTARQLRVNRSSLYTRVRRARTRIKARPCTCLPNSHVPIALTDKGVSFGSEPNPHSLPDLP
jgi:transcriptional regulator with PAS, ATPase and Fis domain